MTDKQFHALVDLQKLTLEVATRTEAKTMVLTQLCADILETTHAATGIGNLTAESIGKYIVADFNKRDAYLRERYQPEIDRIMGELQG